MQNDAAAPSGAYPSNPISTSTITPSTGTHPSQQPIPQQSPPPPAHQPQHVPAAQPPPQPVQIPMYAKAEETERDVDITCPALGGFVVGALLWLPSLFLCCAGGDGKRTSAMRKGIGLGIAASTVGLAVFIGLYAYFIYSLTNINSDYY